MNSPLLHQELARSMRDQLLRDASIRHAPKRDAVPVPPRRARRLQRLFRRPVPA